MKNKLFVIFTIAVLLSAVPNVFAENTSEINNSTAQSQPSVQVTQSSESEKVIEPEVQSQNTTQTSHVPETNTTVESAPVTEPKTEEAPKKEDTPIVANQNQTEEATPKTEDVAAPVNESGKQTTDEETKTVVTPTPSEEIKTEIKATPFMTILGRVIFGFACFGLIILIACIYNYRYQINKYKVAPFTPPSFCPSCLFPKVTSGSGNGFGGYGSIEIGDYNPPRYLEF